MQSIKNEQERYLELDVLRVLAIFLMIAYHLAYDLSIFYEWNIDIFSRSWWLLERCSASLFLLLVGISFSISWQRNGKWKMESGKLRILKNVRRGLIIFGYGCIISFVTYLFDSETYVRFGILHLIGVSTLLLPTFVIFKHWNALSGVAIILVGSLFVTGKTIDSSLLLAVGFVPQHFMSVDYFPLIPWLGVILIGSAIGEQWYIKNLSWRSMLYFDHIQKNFALRWIEKISRKSLLIYLVHQPLILAILWLVLGKPEA